MLSNHFLHSLLFPNSTMFLILATGHLGSNIDMLGRDVVPVLVFVHSSEVILAVICSEALSLSNL